MYRISKRFEFSASHVLEGLPEGHQCGRLHGHNYIVELELESEILDNVGFVLDYGELKPFKVYIDDTLDHRHLNDLFIFNPTAEHLAHHLFALAHKMFPPTDLHPFAVSAVRVYETPKTMAEYRFAG